MPDTLPTFETKEKNKMIRYAQSKKLPQTTAQWSGTIKNQDVRTGPLARPFACSLAPLTHFAHSLARGKVSNLTSQFHLVLNHSAPVLTCLTWMRVGFFYG